MRLRRLGLTPKEHGIICGPVLACPDVFEMPDGNFAIIGRDATEELRAALPHDAGCGATERIVVVPRSVLTAAKRDIAEA